VVVDGYVELRKTAPGDCLAQLFIVVQVGVLGGCLTSPAPNLFEHASKTLIAAVDEEQISSVARQPEGRGVPKSPKRPRLSRRLVPATWQALELRRIRLASARHPVTGVGCDDALFQQLIDILVRVAEFA
jgi:hypothetical protein